VQVEVAAEGGDPIVVFRSNFKCLNAPTARTDKAIEFPDVDATNSPIYLGGVVDRKYKEILPNESGRPGRPLRLESY